MREMLVECGSLTPVTKQQSYRRHCQLHLSLVSCLPQFEHYLVQLEGWCREERELGEGGDLGKGNRGGDEEEG